MKDSKNPVEEYEDYQSQTQPESLNSEEEVPWDYFVWAAILLLFFYAILSN